MWWQLLLQDEISRSLFRWTWIGNFGWWQLPHSLQVSMLCYHLLYKPISWPQQQIKISRYPSIQINLFCRPLANPQMIGLYLFSCYIRRACDWILLRPSTMLQFAASHTTHLSKKKIRPFHHGSTVLIHSTGFHRSSLRISSPHVFSSKINSILGRSDRPNKPFNINCDISILIYELAVSRLYDTCNMTVTAKLNCPLLLYNQSIHSHSFINSMLILSQQVMTANKATASPFCNMRTIIFHDYTMDNVT